MLTRADTELLREMSAWWRLNKNVPPTRDEGRQIRVFTSIGPQVFKSPGFGESDSDSVPDRKTCTIMEWDEDTDEYIDTEDDREVGSFYPIKEGKVFSAVGSPPLAGRISEPLLIKAPTNGVPGRTGAIPGSGLCQILTFDGSTLVNSGNAVACLNWALEDVCSNGERLGKAEYHTGAYWISSEDCNDDSNGGAI